MNRKLVLILAALYMATAPQLSARIWSEASTGRSIEGDYVESDVTHVVVKSGGRTFKIAIARLSDADKAYIKEQTARAPGNSMQQDPVEFQCKVDTFDGGRFWVYAPKSYNGKTPMPLVVASHGREPEVQHPGKHEIDKWITLADEHGFIVACPSYGTACKAGSYYHKGDPDARITATQKLIGAMMPKIFDTYKIDRKRVLATGVENGGYPTLLSMNHPEFFSALSFRNPYFNTYYEKFYKVGKMAQWNGRPVSYYHGKDSKLARISEAKAFLNKHFGPDQLTIENVGDAKVQDLRPEVAKWFMQLPEVP